MKKLVIIIFGFTAFHSIAQQQLVVSPQWLNERLHDPSLVILQTGFLKFDYEAEHIPGARFLWVPWLAPDSPETGNMNVPDFKQANKLLSSLGVSNSSTIVICHIRNEITPAARIFLTLEQLGMKGKVFFLNGGLDAWKKAGYTITTEIPVVKKGKFTAKNGNVIVDKDYVLQNLNADRAIIVDARMARFYNGEPTGNPRDGHITGAKNIPYPDLIDQTTNTFKPIEQLTPFFDAVDPTRKKELVFYCFIGQTASVDYIAARILGYENLHLYDGSLQEWSRKKELPMETTPEKK